MIKITIELISGNTGKTRLLGTGKIINMSGLESDDIADYEIELSKWYPKQDEVWKTTSVKNFNRKKRGSWDLLYLALKNILEKRNNHNGYPKTEKEYIASQ